MLMTTTDTRDAAGAAGRVSKGGSVTIKTLPINAATDVVPGDDWRFITGGPADAHRGILGRLLKSPAVTKTLAQIRKLVWADQTHMDDLKVPILGRRVMCGASAFRSCGRSTSSVPLLR